MGMRTPSYKTIFVIFFAIFIAIVLYVQFYPEHQHSLITPTATSTVAGHPLNSQINISSVTLHQFDQKLGYDIQVSYPKINGLSDIGVQDTINHALYKIVSDDIDQFKAGINGTNFVPALSAPGQSTLSINYASSTPSTVENLVSFTFAQEYYSDGAAHPGHEVNSYTYDLTTGKLITLDDLFIDEYLQVLSSYASSTLAISLGNYADSDMIHQGTAPTADNFKNFIPENDGLHIKFDEYQVAPYVVGSPEIVVPYAVLKNYINPAGPLRSLTI
jgi:hypothetical protein